MSVFRWFRKLKGGVWYKHQFTIDAGQIMLPVGNVFWARYGELNRYTKVISVENYNKT